MWKKDKNDSTKNSAMKIKRRVTEGSIAPKKRKKQNKWRELNITMKENCRSSEKEKNESASSKGKRMDRKKKIIWKKSFGRKRNIKEKNRKI